MDLDAALARTYRRRFGFARLVVGLFVVVDVSFKLLIIPGYLEVLGARTPDGISRLRLCLETSAVTLAGWVVVALWLARAMERWRVAEASADLSEATILRAAVAAQRFPQRMALAWVTEWVLLFAVVTIRAGDASLIAGFFLAAMATGPLPVAHSLSMWLVRPVVRAISLAARARGVVTPRPPLTLRGRLVLYSLTLCVAPTLYMTAVAFAARAVGAPSSSAGHLLTTVLIFIGAIVLFGLVCAALMATTITAPVAEMATLMRAIARQGDVSSVGRVPLYQYDEVGALADVTNQMIDRLELTEIDRASAAAALAALNHTLEGRVARRTEELSRRNVDMHLLLDNVDQGFFTVDHAGAMASEHSAILATWFGPIQPGAPLHRLFEHHDARFAEQLELAWEQVTDGILPIELALEQLPRNLACAGRRYRLSYTAIGAGRPERFLVVVSDETPALEHESLQREKKETLALFEHMLADRTSFIGFMEEASEIVERIVQTGGGDPVAFARALHTLKGNAALYGLDSVAELCHELESYMAEERALPGAPQVAGLADRWGRLSLQVDRLLDKGRHVIEASPEQFAELEHAVRRGASRTDLLRMLHDLTLEPVERRLRHFAEQASRIGQRLDKEIAANVSHDGLRVDARHWSRIWQAFVHVVRNAVDHGIEPAQERAAAAKPRAGRIDLRGVRDGATVVIEIEDDGRGIPWDQLRDRVAAQGMSASTQEELVAALFLGGVSTAPEISDTSGRGVGMGALRAAVLALGGEVEIESEPGRGTRVRLRFPESEIAPPRTPPPAG